MSNDFESRINENYYQQNPFQYSTEKVDWKAHSASRANEFWNDGTEYLISMGVPKQYALKVLEYAWQRCHSDGYYQVFNHLSDLIDIFTA